jgi:hypothetical protein
MQFKIRSIATLCLAFCVLSTTNAQVTFGIKATVNHAWQQYAPNNFDPNVERKVWGYGTAVVIDKQLSKYISVSVEPSFVQRGAKCLPDSRGYKDVTLTANYLCLPILFNARYPLFKNRLFVTAALGENASWFMSGKQVFTFTWGNTEGQTVKLDMKTAGYNRIDIGLDGGFGFSIPIKKGFIDLNMRYYYGLRDVDEDFTSKNRSVAYQLGYRLSL